jgi:hypothetical protein
MQQPKRAHNNVSIDKLGPYKVDKAAPVRSVLLLGLDSEQPISDPFPGSEALEKRKIPPCPTLLGEMVSIRAAMIL